MQMVPFRGYSITPLTIEEYRNLHELRLLIEPGIAALAAERATSEQLKEMELWASYDYKSSQKSSYYTSLEWNRKFHISIAVASRNQSLLEIVTNTQTRLMRYAYLVIAVDRYGPQLSSEHKALVRAIRSGNAEMAKEKALDHLNKTDTRGLRVDWRMVNLPSEGNDGISMANRPLETSPTAAKAKSRPSARRSTSPVRSSCITIPQDISNRPMKIPVMLTC
jgi:DNA-binding GntR family transcriptional regulator